jgi:serine phosphatase RsbU (regulator of sigma subunit)
VSVNGSLLGAALILGIMLLELKDKLLARHELEAGRAVQRALMPQHCPSLAGWDVWMYTRPANDVGGDLVDCLELGPGRVGFALADVAGKALPAALLMAKVQATLRALATDAPSLSDLAAKTNTILCRDGLPNRFATLVYVEARDTDGAVRLVNAGHMPPVRISGGTYHELRRGDMALGMIPGSTYEEQHEELQPGDMLITYSDGLTEALNEAGEFYGDERLQAIFPTLSGLTAKEAGAALLRSVDAFIATTRPYDDLSLFILKRL